MLTHDERTLFRTITQALHGLAHHPTDTFRDCPMAVCAKAKDTLNERTLIQGFSGRMRMP